MANLSVTTLSSAEGAESPSDDELKVISEWVFFVAFPALIALGILGNTASLILMQTDPVRKLSISVYLSALACGDSAALVYIFLRLWLAPYYVGMEMFTGTDISCKLEMIFRRIVYVFPSWIIVSVSAERLLVTVRPLVAATTNLRKRAIVLVSVVLLLTVGYGIIEITPMGITSGSCQLENYYYWIRKLNGKWMLPVLYTYAPSFLILMFSVSTAAILLYKSRRQVALGRTGRADVMTSRASRTVITVAVCYLMLTLPGTIMYPLTVRQRLRHGGPPGLLSIAVTVCRLLQFSNHSINFLLYVATGENFRAPLRRFCCRTLVQRRSTESGRGDSGNPLIRGSTGRGDSGRGDSGRGDSWRGDSGRGDSGNPLIRGSTGRGDSGRGDSGRGDSWRGDSGRGDSGNPLIRGSTGRGDSGRGDLGNPLIRVKAQDWERRKVQRR